MMMAFVQIGFQASITWQAAFSSISISFCLKPGSAYVTVGKDKTMVFTLLGGTEMKA